MKKIKLILEYDGTDYVGWQVQQNGQAIQEVVQRAISTMVGEKVSLLGASRTDAGVHALQQVALFSTTSTISCDSFLRGLKSLLPRDIAVKHVEEVQSTFHVIKDAKQKIYRYYLWNDITASPLLRRFTWHVRKPLNVKAMQKGAQHFKGRHDFSSFMASRSGVKTTVRTITRFTVGRAQHIPFEVMPSSSKGRLIVFTVEGNGFLRNQVRNMVGTLVEIGEGKREPHETNTILKAAKRTAAGVCAPPQGLFLMKVTY